MLQVGYSSSKILGKQLEYVPLFTYWISGGSSVVGLDWHQNHIISIEQILLVTQADLATTEQILQTTEMNILTKIAGKVWLDLVRNKIFIQWKWKLVIKGKK